MNSSRSTSTSSSGSTTSSGSSSCSDSGSTSTDSESTTSSDDKPLNSSRGNDNKTKPPVTTTTRRKSSESKTNQQKTTSTTTAEVEKTTKLNTSNSNSGAAQKQPAKNVVYSSDDDTPPTKKPLKRLSTSSTAQLSQRRRSSGGFALTASKLQKPQTETTAPKTTEVESDSKVVKANENDKEKPTVLPIEAEAEELAKTSTTTPVKKAKQEIPPKITPKATNSVNEQNDQPAAAAKAKPVPNKRASGTSQPIRAAAASTSKKKCSDDSEYDSVSGSEDETSSTSTETESSDNSSYNSKDEKGSGGGVGGKRRPRNRLSEIGAKNKNDFSDSEGGQSPPKNTRNRKLTRSLSTRRNSKQIVKTSAGASQQDIASDSDSEALNGTVGDIKRSLCKSPAKKSYIGLGSTSLSKCSVKKEISNNGFPSMSRAPTPPQLEKRCPVDGCDSSGHLSGNLDRHFLPEACPIYHNMSVSECKERANERKLRAEALSKLATSSNHVDGHKAGSQTSSKYPQTPEQKEFYNKIRESRARFKPIAEVVNCDKVKLEKDCNDEDREPSLVGLVPDYDLQLFRDAQALASEKIEEEVKDLPIGKGIK